MNWKNKKRVIYSVCMCFFHQAVKRVWNIKQNYHEEIIHFQGKYTECVCIHLHVCVFAGQELSSVNYLELYRVADLFHLPSLEEAVVAFLVEHLSELSQSRQDEAQQLPCRLLREVLKSDRLTSLSEEEIWKVPKACLRVGCIVHVKI